MSMEDSKSIVYQIEVVKHGEDLFKTDITVNKEKAEMAYKILCNLMPKEDYCIYLNERTGEYKHTEILMLCRE